MKKYFLLIFACTLLFSALRAAAPEASFSNEISNSGGNCDTPTALTASGQTGTETTLGWAAAPTATHYTVNVVNGANNTTPFNVTASVTGTTYTVTGLTPGLNYKFKVRTNCDNGDNSNWSAWVAFNSSVTSNGPCTVPTGLTASSPVAGEAQLNWSAVGGAASYFVNVSNGSGNPNVFNQNFTVTTNSLYVTGLLPGFNYKFKVRSNCIGGGHTAWSPTKTFNTLPGAGGPCTIPAGLAASATGPGAATLTWGAVGGADAYAVQVEDGTGNPNDFLLNDTATTNSLSVSGLIPGLNYKFKVRSLCTGGGNTNWSSWKFFTTPLASAAPGNISADRFGAGAAFALQISPNPVRNAAQIAISGADGQLVNLKLFDLTGKMLRNQDLQASGEEANVALDLSDFPNGLYLLKAQKGAQVFTQKLLLDK